MSKHSRDYLLWLFAKTPRYGMVSWNNDPSRVEFTDTPQGEWCRVEDVEELLDHLEDNEADEASA